MNIYTIHGKQINDLEALYREFARAVDAPDGYFGKSLDSFDDCLFGGFGLETPCQISWEDSDQSKQALNCKALENYCLSVIENSPYLSLEGFEEGTEWAYTTLAAATSGKKSLFDEVIEMILSVPERASWDHKIELILK